MLEGFNKKIYKESNFGLARSLPWAFIADCEGASGVVVQKSGCMQKSYAFRGPDLDAASSATVADLDPTQRCAETIRVWLGGVHGDPKLYDSRVSWGEVHKPRCLPRGCRAPSDLHSLGSLAVYGHPP